MTRPPLPTDLERALKTSLEIAHNKPPSLTLSQAIAAHTGALDVSPEDAPLPGHEPRDERAAGLGWRIIDGGAL